MPTSSLIVLRGDQNARSDTEYEYAELAGVKFIELRHRRRSGPTTYHARGFQGVTVSVRQDRDGGRRFDAEYDINEDGKPKRALRPLIFEPVGRAQLLTAMLPDTDFNRNKLALRYIDGGFWSIQDPEVLADVKARAKVIEENLPKGPTKEEIIRRQAEENERLREQLALTRRQAKEARETAVAVVEARRAIKELPVELKDSIQEIVHEENASVIEKLKEQSPNGWMRTKKYKELVQPAIDERERQELEKLNADYSGAGIGNQA